MENAEALRQFMKGGVFLCLDVPKGTEFGIDQYSWTTGDQFKGIKMIPPGFHYIRWRNSTTTDTISGKDADRVMDLTQQGSNSGIIPLMNSFLFIQPSQIVTHRWDSSIEDIIPLQEEESERYKAGVRRMEFDSYLGAFPLDSDQLQSWKSLTQFISPQTINKCTLCTKEQNQFEFTSIPKRWIPENEKSCVGADRTKYFMDKSYLLHHLIETNFNHSWENLFGEFQFSFICFWLAECYEAFEQWKDWICLFCNCEKSLEMYAEKWVNILNMIESQLSEVPKDFFVDILSCKNFLEPTLRSLFELVGYADTESSLGKSFSKLKLTCEKRFEKSFTMIQPIEDYSDDEDLPVVVEFS